MSVFCPICNKEYQDGRRLHGHLMRTHQEEYRAADFDKSKLKPGKKQKDKPAEKKRPAGFRLLRLSDPDENEAYQAGYAYIDDEDNVYEHDEAKGEGWV